MYYLQVVDIILTYLKDLKIYFDKNMAANEVIMGGTGR